MDLMTLVSKVILDQSGFNADVDSLTSSGSSASKAFGSWGVTVGNLASKAITKSIRATMDFLEGIVTTGMNFDKEMSAVKAVAQMTDSEFDAVRQKAVELGGSTVFTSEQVGEAFYYMGLAGWDAQEMLDGVAGVLDLAAASGEDLGRVSDIVTDAITAMGLSAKDTQHFVDVLAAASANSNTTVDMMGEAFKYIAPVAGMLHYSIDDLAASLGLLANNGIKGSQAGTSLRRILSNLIDPSEDAVEALSALGIHMYGENYKIKPFLQLMQELRQVMKDSGFDAAGNDMEEFQKKLEELDKEAEEKGLDDTQYKNALETMATKFLNPDFLKALSEIGGVRGITSLMAIMKSTDEDFDQLVSSIAQSEGAAGKMSGTMLDNLAGDITLLNSALDNLKIEIFDKFNDTLRSFTQGLTDFIVWLSGGPETIGKTFDRADESMENMIDTADSDEKAVKSLIDYMNELSGPTGTSAENLEKWNAAAQRLTELCPDLIQYIDTTAGKFTAEAAEINKATEAYFNNVRQKAIDVATSEKWNAIAKATGELTKKEVELNVLKGRVDYDEKKAAATDVINKLMADTSGTTSRARDIISQYGDVSTWTDRTWGTVLGLLETETVSVLNQKGSLAGTDWAKLLNPEGGVQGFGYLSKAFNAVAGESSEINGLKTQLEEYTKQYEEFKAAASDYISTLQGELNALPTEVNIDVNVGDNVDGSHATGLSYVPYDNYIARLHRGEQVLTAQEARSSSSPIDIDALASAIASAVSSSLAGMAVDMDGQRVGSVVTPVVAKNIAAQLRSGRY